MANRASAVPAGASTTATPTPLFAELAIARRWLLRSYLLHVAWFVLMCLFIVFGWKQRGLHVSVLLTLVTVPPVLWATVRVHVVCRRIDPRSATVGWVPVIVTTLILSPFESGLVLPAKNLWVATRLLRQASAEPLPARQRDTGP